MKKLTDAFAYIFSDNEWFNKVLIGGFYFLLIPFGIGMIMVNGFLTEFVLKRNSGEKSMPFWRNYQVIFNAGIQRSFFALTVLILVYCSLFFNFPVTIPAAILLLVTVITVNAVIITRTFDLLSLFISITLLLIAVSIGWMWIVVGWPLLIFLAMLVQIYLLAKK